MLGAVWWAHQTPSTLSARVTAMKPLEPLVGEWTGTGWSMNQTGQRTEFELTEKVDRRVSGTALLIEGHGHAKGQPGVTTHDGLSVLYYDEKTAHYRWNGHEASSGTVDVDVKLIDGGFEWALGAPRNSIVRFQIRFDAKEWNEVGEASADGRTWNRFMEMKLTKR